MNDMRHNRIKNIINYEPILKFYKSVQIIYN